MDDSRHFFLLFLFTNFFYQTIKKCIHFTPPYNSPSVAWNTRKCRCNEFARVQRPEEFFFSDRVWPVLDNIDISQSYLVCPTFSGKKNK